MWGELSQTLPPRHVETGTGQEEAPSACTQLSDNLVGSALLWLELRGEGRRGLKSGSLAASWEGAGAPPLAGQGQCRKARIPPAQQANDRLLDSVAL